MPKVIGHTPAWLSHPSPGARIFSDPEVSATASTAEGLAVVSTDHGSGPRRTIAHRGTEIFAVVGDRIRWADLCRVQSAWEDGNRKQATPDLSPPQAYRTLRTNTGPGIRTLSVSPSGNFLAISTEYTVHIAVLPDSSRLSDGDLSDIKLRTFQLGPTTHTMPESPVVAVLWHPFAPSSNTVDCLVTVTVEAAVRLWEVDRTNHWSFERPVQALDLRKLADATSSDEHFEPSAYSHNRGFSVDAFDMEVAAATWGGYGHDNEDPWAAMTLWTSMLNGDIYALCPLLPSKWRPTGYTIGALSTSALSRTATSTASQTSDEQRAVGQHLEWVEQLDNEEVPADLLDDTIYLRPSKPSAIPRLQGPFYLPIDDLGYGEVSDILVIPASLDREENFSGEDDYEDLAKSFPFTVVCLATTDNQLHIMIELAGVTGQWLPRKGRGQYSLPTSDAGEFILLETITLQARAATETGYPTFTADPSNPYIFFVTTASSIWSFSLEDWASHIGLEFNDHDAKTVDAGLRTRLDVTCGGDICIKQALISPQQTKTDQEHLTTVAFVEDTDFGSIVLSSSAGRAVAVQLDLLSFRVSQAHRNEPAFSNSTTSPYKASQALMQVLEKELHEGVASPPTRAPFAPSQTFYQDHMVPLEHLRKGLKKERQAMLTQKPLRLSPACLDVMMGAHRTISHQAANIEDAAAELFRRCERLGDDLKDQLRQMAELADRLVHIKSGSETARKAPSDSKTHSEKIDDRIEAAKAKQKELFSRYERVRRKAGQVSHGKQELSINERSWIQEIDGHAKDIGEDPGTLKQEQKQDDALFSRLTNAKTLSKELITEAKSIKEASSVDKDASSTPDGKSRPRASASSGLSRFQREKVQEIKDMVDREGAIIEATQSRLQGRLQQLGISFDGLIL